MAPAASCPGLPDVSDHIRVRSIVGEFLEHSRIWMFGNGGRAEWYIGSADLMERNLDRRVEVVTPVEDHEAQARLARIIEVMLADDRRSWQLQPDGGWIRSEVLQSVDGTIDTFAVLKEDAATAAALADVPRRAGAGGRLHGSEGVMDGIAQRPLEVELKYRMSGVAAGERLLAADELAGLRALGPATDVLQEDRYLDTPDAALAAAGYAGRLRSTDSGTIISLKGLKRTGRRRGHPPPR